jgi:transcriptional regulator with XRE-family HTH domain
MGASRFEKARRRLGEAIRARRIERGQTQEAVAFATGLSVRQYQRIERGTVNPTFKSLLGISELLECSLRELL